MTIYYQHIGEKLWARDAPRSIGATQNGLKRFSWLDIEPYLDAIDPLEALTMRAKIADLAPTGFQLWGLPSGAERVLKDMETGDFLMLLESVDFGYVGQVLHRVSQPLWRLSQHIWNEQGFPIIVLLQGELITYGWDEFKVHFGIMPNYDLRGATAKLKTGRVTASPSGNEDTFIATLLARSGVSVIDLETDFRAFASNLQQHFRLVKQRANQKAFRSAVLSKQGHLCAVCDLAIPQAIDAAHLIPKEHNGGDDFRNGVALCVLHHRLFDAGLFSVHPTSLALHASGEQTLADLRITRHSISHLQCPPHHEALLWRWKRLHS